MKINRSDIIALNGNDGLHYEWVVKGVIHRLNPNGRYALYKTERGQWRESASVTNDDLMGKD